MRIANKVGVLLAMALAALAFAATTATAAATVTPPGDYTLTELGAGTLKNEVFTVICTLSHVNANVQQNGAVTIQTASFTSCQTLALVSCTVAVTLTPTDGSSIAAELTDGESTDTSPTAMTIAAGETPNANITCGGTTCTFGGDTTTTFEVWEGTNAFVTASDTLWLVAGNTMVCGNTADWDAAWTVPEPSSFSITPPSFS